MTLDAADITAITTVITTALSSGVKASQLSPEAMDPLIERLAQRLLCRDVLHAGYAQGGDSVVHCGGNSAIVTGAGNSSGGSGRRRNVLQLGHTTRFMQAGTVVSLDVYAAAVPWEMRLVVWRPSGNNYNRVGESENFAPRLTAGAVNHIELSRPISGVQEGDYYGWELYYGTCLTVLTGQGAGAAFKWIDSAVLDSVNVNFGAGSSSSGALLPLKLYMRAPGFVTIGDSNICGHPDHYSYLETTAINAPNASPAYMLGQLNGLTYQNRGKGGQTSTALAARFQTDAVDLAPGFIVVLVGAQDVYNIADPTDAGQVDAAKTAYLENIDACLDLAEAASIPVVLLRILPWTNATNDQHLVRHDWNAALSARASATVLVVDLEESLGQYKTGGADGNFDDIATAYSYGDGAHYNTAGRTVMAAGINAAIESHPAFEALCLGTAGADTLLLAGDAMSGSTPYHGCRLQVVSGPGAGQSRAIIAQTGRLVTVDRAWDVRPDRRSKYSVTGRCT